MNRTKSRDVYSDIVFSKIMGERYREIEEEKKQISLHERREKLSDFITKLERIFSNEDTIIWGEIRKSLISKWLKYNNKDVAHAIIQVEPYIGMCASTTQSKWVSLKNEFNSVF